MEKTLYNIDLHEEIVIKEDDTTMVTALRVPGGWLYKHFEPFALDDDNLTCVHQAFVPFNDEFSEDYDEELEQLNS